MGLCESGPKNPLQQGGQLNDILANFQEKFELFNDLKNSGKNKAIFFENLIFLKFESL